jgi:outer membrane cobalamin receptor
VSAAFAQADTSHLPARDTTRARSLGVITVTGRADLRERPIAREGELLESVPGLIATQHSGDGKANQYFVRGVNLDHGTDFQTRVEGVPLNMPTHGHGQGYTDLNFLIPELISRVDYWKERTTPTSATSARPAAPTCTTTT